MGRCCETEMNVKKIKVRISRQPSSVEIKVDQKQPENVEYFNYLGNKISNEICVREIKSRVAITTATFKKNKTLVTSNLDFKLKEITSKVAMKLVEFGK
jgi:hypothetical protein